MKVTGLKKLEVTAIANELIISITRELDHEPWKIYHKYNDINDYSTERLERIVNKLVKEKHVRKSCEIGLAYLHIELSWYSPARRK